jgi:hypothetical protein
LTVSLFVANCGRKNSNFLNFEKKEKLVKINRLSLPSVNGISVKKINSKKEYVEWQPVQEIKNVKLLGYNLYRFSKIAFIPKKPLNKNPIKQTHYTICSSDKNFSTCYIVRAIFKVALKATGKVKVCQGPASKIICISKNPPT